MQGVYRIINFLKNRSGSELISFAIVFLCILGTAKFGQFIFSMGTSPAVIWPPAGIAFAAILLCGYEMSIPIALAYLLAFTSFGLPLPIVVLATLGHTLQPIAGAALMRRYGFSTKIATIRDVLLIMIGAIVVTMIAPSFGVIGQIFFGSSSGSTLITWGRAWVGDILSVLILTSLICTWVTREMHELLHKQLLELSAVFAMLLATSYLLFWTGNSMIAGISLVYVLLIPLFWIGLRFGPKTMTAALLATAAMSLSGAMLNDTLGTNIGIRLFQQEILLIALSVIFLIFASIVEERRDSANELESKIRELETALKQINQADRAKNEFIAILAHELRNPLAPLMSNVEIMKLLPHTLEEKKMLEAMEDNVRGMSRLLDDILDVSSMTQQKFQIQREWIELLTIVERSRTSADVLMQKKNQKLVISLPSQNVRLHVDPVRFQQIIVNLLNNAAKYSPPGSSIELRASAENDMLYIQVRDYGIGMTPDAFQKIFEPFRQLLPGTSSGLGIGLSVAKRLIELHGGDVVALSDGLGKGTTFTISVPLPHAQTLFLPAAKMREQLPMATKPKMNILVIDDNEAAAMSLSKLLEYRGHTVTIGFDGEQALFSATHSQPDIIILDIGLPGMDGYEVARRLRASDSAAYLIAVSGYGQEEDKLRAMDAGFNHHLTKPIGLADLEKIFEQIQSK